MAPTQLFHAIRGFLTRPRAGVTHLQELRPKVAPPSNLASASDQLN